MGALVAPCLTPPVMLILCVLLLLDPNDVGLGPLDLSLISELATLFATSSVLPILVL